MRSLLRFKKQMQLENRKMEEVMKKTKVSGVYAVQSHSWVLTCGLRAAFNRWRTWGLSAIMPPNLELKNSAFFPYIGIAEKANTEIFRQYQRILENTEIFPVNKLLGKSWGRPWNINILGESLGTSVKYQHSPGHLCLTTASSRTWKGWRLFRPLKQVRLHLL